MLSSNWAKVVLKRPVGKIVEISALQAPEAMTEIEEIACFTDIHSRGPRGTLERQ
jgi:hypothetical protein